MKQRNAGIRRLAAAGAVLAVAFLGRPGAIDAQIRGSERGTISQVVNGTTISIDYGRPHVRGRTMFGGQIHWGEVWTPGANLATTIDFSKDVDFVGMPVGAGTYSMWVVPAEAGAWEVILDPNAMLYHTQPPPRHDGQVVVSVMPEEIPLRESLLFDFARVEPYGTDLDLRFETVSLPLRIDVHGDPIPEISEAEAALYVGGYEMELPPGAPVPPGMGTVVMELTWRDGRFDRRASDADGPHGVDDGARRRAYLPTRPHAQWRSSSRSSRTCTSSSSSRDGRVVRMDARGLGDELMFSAERVR